MWLQPGDNKNRDTRGLEGRAESHELIRGGRGSCDSGSKGVTLAACGECRMDRGGAIRGPPRSREEGMGLVRSPQEGRSLLIGGVCQILNFGPSASDEKTKASS